MGNINLQELMPAMLSGTVTSLNIFFLTLLISLPLGLLIAAGRMSRLKIIRYPVQVYLLIMRGTPLMLQLFFSILALITYWASAEPAALPWQLLLSASTIPLILRKFTEAEWKGFPPTGNEFITLVKDTALARVIAVSELFDVAAKAASGSVSTAPFIVAAVFYLIMNAAVGQAFSFAERKLDYYR